MTQAIELLLEFVVFFGEPFNFSVRSSTSWPIFEILDLLVCVAMTAPNGAGVTGTNEMRGQRMIGGWIQGRNARLKNTGKMSKKRR